MKNLRIISAIFVTVFTLQAHASPKIAVFNTSAIYPALRGYLIGEGKWASVPDECIKFIDQETSEDGFSAAAPPGSPIADCENAVVTLDLEGSSYCKDQGGTEVFFRPKIIAVDCR